MTLSRFITAALFIGASIVHVHTATGQAAPRQTTPVTDAMLTANQTGTEWLSYGMTPGETRYSPLRQINDSNAGRLGLAWTYQIDASQDGGQESTPLVHNGIMYTITNWSIVFALDARTGEEIWRWDPEVNRVTVRPKVCCGIVNRGLAIYGTNIIAPSIDGRLFALDAATGKPVWETRVAYSQDSYTITMAPRIAKGKVIIGVSGAEFPVRGYFDAYDAVTGKRDWRFYTVPGDPSKPFESEAMRVASATWAPDSWKLGGGGTVWDAISYDPEQEIVMVGTGNAGPWPDDLRGTVGKDALYAASIVAVDVNNGELKWYYQVVPGDNWDFDAVQQLLQADLMIDGQLRKVVMQANKNGFYYVIDRTNGKFISGAPFATVNWAAGLDEVTGRPIVNAGANYSETESTRINPGPGGAHNWPPMSFNPQTGLVYIPGQSGGRGFNYAVAQNFQFQPGELNLGIVFGAPTPPSESQDVANAAARAGQPQAEPKPVVPNADLPTIGPDVNGNNLVAWDPITNTEKWRVMEGGSIYGGTMTTGGNLVFQSTPDGKFIVYKADDGAKLFETELKVRNMAPPMTFELDGTQYVAVMGGIGRGEAAGFGTTNPSANEPKPHVFVFKLDGTAALPGPPAAN